MKGKNVEPLWFAARIMLAILVIAAGFVTSCREEHVGLVAVLFPIALAIGLCVWLMSQSAKPCVVWLDWVSITSPFFPLTRYPMQFWMTISIYEIVGGLASTIHNLNECRFIETTNPMYILSGVLNIMCLAGFWYSPTNAHNRRSAIRSSND